MANQYTSYYLYQKYEKRGSQDWLPCYPNIFSVDGEGTMPLVIKTENDPECGYTPPAEPIYRWYNMPITTDYVCDTCPALQYRWVNKAINVDYECVGTDKYYVQKRQYSYDSGTTWNDVVPEETQRGSLYESGSTDCGYVPPTPPQYRTTSGTPYCTGYDLYVNVYSQVSYDEGITWETTATTITLVQENSPQCGYVPSYQNQYFTIEAIDSGMKVTSTGRFDYSLDSGSTWNTLTTNQSTPVLGQGDKVMLKSTSGYQDSGFVRFRIDGTGRKRYNVEGNIASLLVSDETFTGVTELNSTAASAFTNLFMSSNGVVSAENLVIPFTNMSNYCCYGMFSGCTAMTTPPQLPATTLAIYCYYGMFRGCTSLTTAPELPATNLVGYCYENMFYGCSSLNYIKCLASNIGSYRCTNDWVRGVSSSGIFVKNSSMSGWSRGVNGIPTNWTVQDA